MSIIPEVKCRRCGATFSSLRSVCPECGTRRVAQSGRTPSATPSTVQGTASYERAETNTKWQMIFGLILVAAVILAIIVMVSTTLNGADTQGSVKTTPTVDPNLMAPPSIEPPPTVAPTNTPSLEKLEMRCLGTKVMGDDWVDKNNYSPSLRLNQDETINVTVAVYPVTVSVSPENIHWSVDDESVVELTPKEDGSCDVHILATKGGGVVLTVEVFGITTSARIYCIEGS